MRQYIAGGADLNTREKHVCAPLFRRKFEYFRNFNEKTSIEISAVGFYRLFLNGRELTKGFFAPYVSNPEHIVYFDEYEAEGLVEGENEFCILLGNGFSNALDGGVWDFEKASYRSAPKVFLRLNVGDKIIVSTDENFEVFDSPITFDDLRCGEHFDARRLPGGKFDFESNRRGNAVCVTSPAGEYKRCAAQPIKSFEVLSPVRISKSGEGYLYDFGQVNAGLCRLKIDGTFGQRVKLVFGEMVRRGKLDQSNITFGERSFPGYIQEDRYVCREGAQEYLPSFTYHGFRYVYVEGVTERQASEDLLRFVVIHSDIPDRGSFSCSNETANRIQEIVRRSDTSNFHYFPTDCPQREKNGWTADASLSAEQLLYNFDCEKSLREWLNNIRKAQREDGSLPGIVPTSGWGYSWGNGPAWDSVLIELPFQIYRFTEDNEVISENAEAIRRYFRYLSGKKNADGLFAFGLGDWCEVGTFAEDRYATPLEVTDSLTCFDLSKKAAFLFEAVGEEKMAEELISFGDELRTAFRKKHIANGAVTCRTQTAQAMAIRFGVFEESELCAAYACMKELLFVKNGHFQTGVLGVKALFDALTVAGQAETAFESIVREDFPSYGYLLKNGATTLWEGINELREGEGDCVRLDGGRPLSLNHHFWGSVSAWFYRVPGGLDVVGKNQVKISPHFLSQLDWANAEYHSGEYSIRVHWERTDEGIHLRIDCRKFCGEIQLNTHVFEDGKSERKLSEGVHHYLLLS